LRREEEELHDQIQALIRRTQEQGQHLPLVHLATTFNLSRLELDVLLITLAPAIDLRYERLYGYLQDDVTKKRPTVNLTLDLLAGAYGRSGAGRLTMLAPFHADATLLRHRLVALKPPPDAPEAPLLARRLHIDEGILAWLAGSYRPHPDLAHHASLHQVRAEALQPLLDADLRDQLKALPPDAILALYGADATAQRAAAGLIAAAEARPLLRVDLTGAAEEPDKARHLVALALRDARLTGVVLLLEGWDACLDDEMVPPDLLGALTRYPGTVILAGQTMWHPKGLPRERPVIHLELPVPSYAQRKTLWATFVGNEDEANILGLEELAGQFALTSGQIRDAVATARDLAARRAGSAEQPHLTREDLFAAARAHSNPRLARLARKVTPRYGWDDIVLPEDQRALLHEVIDTVRGRAKVLDTWGVGVKLASSRGVTVLFAGEPGTGKTMAAEIIAAELGLDLYKIDLSTVVSKYIGETEKNIERIFSEAEQSNAILFFDEADALFGKRSEVRDAHDRYANIEVSYLLQRMEAYDGVTILATNLRGNLDEAFTRRLHFAINFPFPEEEDRRRIWRSLFPPNLPRVPDLDFDLLAKRFRLAGGNIRNIIVAAAYLAAADGEVVTMEHLLHGTRRELQKMGRLVREEDLTIS
jgi:SpoVK/Ycf46/Vps4 family AAA+-type ATPase